MVNDMVWEDVIKRSKEEWKMLGEVLTGEFTQEFWQRRSIPTEMKDLKKKIDSLPSHAKKAIEELFNRGLDTTDEMRTIIMALIEQIVALAE
jgi:hypothetical protein